MSDSRDTLRYLTAFTLGVVCTGIFVLITRDSRHSKTESEASWRPPQPGPSEPRPQTFQRLRPRGTPPPETEEAGGSTHSIAEPETAPTAPPPVQVTVEPPPLPIPAVVHRTVVAPPQLADVPTAPVEATRVSGRVFLRGEPPPEKILPLDAICAAKQRQRPATTRHFVLGKDKGLADVLISVVEGGRLGLGAGPAPRAPATLRLRGCVFEPYISAIQVHQRLAVINLDDTVHALRVVSQENGEATRSIRPRRQVDFVFDRPERSIRFNCEVHPWEFAYVSVFDHPFFAVTDANGNFVIRGLPPGRYQLEAHHRKAGTAMQEIEVVAHRGTTAEFTLEVAPGGFVSFR